MIDYAQEYIDAVENGKIKVNIKMQQAIDRHKRDIERSKLDDFEYVYDVEKIQMPIKFIESLPDPKSSKTNDLALFQKFIIAQIFGWVHKKNRLQKI